MDFLSHHQSIVKMIDNFLRPPIRPEDELETYKPIWVKEAERLRQKVEAFEDRKSVV